MPVPRSLRNSYRELLLLCCVLGSGAPVLQAAEQRFDVLEYRVLGNTRLPDDVIESAVYPFLGPDLSLSEVESARAGLEQAYRNRGYGTVYVDIPEQSVDAGVVRLRVTEGVLRSVTVEGARYFSGRQIRAALPAATPGEAPELPALQTQLAALNAQIPDRQVTPVLAAGPVPGTVDLQLMVTDKLPFHGGFEINDRYTANTSRLRATLSLNYDNMFNRRDSFGLQYQTAPQHPGELGVLAANYRVRVGEGGDSLSLLFVNSNSDVAALGTLAVLGNGQIYSLTYQRSLLRTFQSVQSLTFGVEYKDFRERIQLPDDGDPDTPDSFVTPISYVNASLGYAGNWRNAGSQFTLSSNINFGVRPGANSPAEFANKRYRARPNYIYLRSEAGASFAAPLHSTLRLRLGGQFALDPVIANEQYAVGGFDGPRGYLDAEDLGDRALRAAVELAAPQLRSGEHFGMEVFGFVDGAAVWTVHPLPGQSTRAALGSLGAGLHLSAFGNVSAALLWAQPVREAGRFSMGDSRLHFSIRSSW